MEYMIVFTETAAEAAIRQDPAAAPQYWAAWGAYIGAMKAAGVMTSGAGLQPPHTATTVRVRDGKRAVQDGPFADSKEQLAGFSVIDVPDLDTALDWAARAPSASYASVEVRPVLPPMTAPGA